jgi:hypothetical protein
MRTPYALVFVALAGAASLGACQDQRQDIAELPSVPSAFPELLFPPGGVLKARAGSEDALQLIFHAPGDPAQVATGYRTRLSTAPWHIVSDRQEGDLTTIYAESNGRPLWLRIAPEPGVGSRVELSGAVLARSERSKADSAAAAADSSAATARRADSTPRR